MKNKTAKNGEIANLSYLRPAPAKSMPLDIGVIHFVGIGGIGMSGIAEILHNIGYQISGSDVSDSANVKRLRKMGIAVAIGHKAENLDNVSVVVKSTAVPLSNPEIVAAREKQIPVVRRSEMLAELTHLKATIAVAGSHGKTTTTSMVAKVLDAANMDPTVINGGIINSYGTNARLGGGDWLVAEADESDGTFIKIPATIGIITNVDPEHLDHWGSYDSLRNAFRTFVENLPFYGSAILCNDDDELRKLAISITDRRILTYSVKDNKSDFFATNIRNNGSSTNYDVVISGRITSNKKKKTLKNIFLPVPGIHNVLNSLSAIAVAKELKIDDGVIISSFAGFSGVKRRFTKTGESGGVTIIDDYGHHPTEIAATLKAARGVVKKKGRVIAVFQPHRYSRLDNLFVEFCDCFSDADLVIVSEIYAAGEKPIEGLNTDSIIIGLKKNGVKAIPLSNPEELAKMINKHAKPDDYVICLGAGSITYWANELPDQLNKLRKKI